MEDAVFKKINGDKSASAWDVFRKKYYPKITPFLVRQRLLFPDTKIHSYSHVARCLIIVHSLSKYHGLSFEEEMACLIAIAFHDSAREDDGEDLWEAESGMLATKFCFENDFSQKFCDEVYSLITEKTYYDNLPTKSLIVCHDADCLDIIRVFGMEDFDATHFVSFQDNDYLRTRFINETNDLIERMYDDDYYFDTRDSLHLVLKELKSDWRSSFEVLNPYQ